MFAKNSSVLSTLALVSAFSGLVASQDDTQWIQVNWQSTTTCVDPGGPVRSYPEGTCFDLSDTDHGITIVDLPSGCEVDAYADTGCVGNPDAYTTTGCWSLQGMYSVYFVC